VIAIDPADRGDDFAAISAVIRDNNIYVDNFICNNDGLDVNVPASVDMIEAARPNEVHIEGNGGWVQTAYNIRDRVWACSQSTRVVIFTSTTNKGARIEAQGYYLRANVFFRKDWQSDRDYSRAVKVITSYVRGLANQTDDAIDTMCRVISHARNNNLIVS
jgi:hypothetical protein